MIICEAVCQKQSELGRGQNEFLKSDLRYFFNIAGKGQKIDFAYNL